jgi:endoglucanase
MANLRCVVALSAASLSLSAAVIGGVAESCMEWGSNIPGVYNKDYTSPLNASAAYFLGKDFGVIRMPLMWERLQPSLTAPVVFDPFYLSLIDEYVAFVTGQGMQLILDPHNYARYRYCGGWGRWETRVRARA